MNNIQIIEAFSAEHFEFLSQYSQVAVIVDENTGALCYPVIKDFLPEHHVIEIQSGEEQKHLGTCQIIWERMTALKFDRHAIVLNLGGGVIGDMGGFCAASYKRGIDFVQIPTTLLAQVDASVGGKLGIDFQGYKNHIGMFRIPNIVMISPVFLKTLPDRELRSGFAEVIKHALIRDKVHWQELIDSKFPNLSWVDVIPHSVSIKDQVVVEDPTEKNVRKILNFGHTIGHAVETYYLDKGERRLLHGEAIAIGMIAEAYLAQEKGFIAADEYQQIEQYILQLFGKVSVSGDEISALLDNALQDKKNENGVILASLLDEVGKANFNQAITLQEIETALTHYMSL